MPYEVGQGRIDSDGADSLAQADSARFLFADGRSRPIGHVLRGEA